MERLEIVERAFLAEPSVKECVVLRLQTGCENDQIVAYVTPMCPVPPGQWHVPSGQWHAHLASRVPTGLLPDVYVALAKLPPPRDGRIDEACLLGMRVLDSDVFWVGQPAPGIGPHPPGASDARPFHPLIGKRLSSPALSDAVFESSVSVESVPLMGDHRCGNIPVIPGTCYLALALEAAQRALGMSQSVLEDVTFAQALAIPHGEQRTLQLILSFGDGLGEYFKVVSRRGESTGHEDSWTIHASGSVARLEPDAAELPVMSADSRAQFTQRARQIDSDAFYEAMQQHDVQLGPGFRVIQSAWIDDDDVLCRLRVPEGVDGFDAFPVHPVLLDACLQVLGGAKPYDRDRTLIPIGVERLRFFARPQGRALWCRVSMRPGQSDVWLADACLFEEEGRPIASLEGLHYDEVRSDMLLHVLGADVSCGSDEQAERVGAKPQGEFVARLAESAAGERRSMVFHLVGDLASELLGLASPDSLASDRGFFEAGMDSLRMVQFSTRLQAVLGCSLPSTLAFKYSTLEKLGTYLSDEVLDLGAVSDDRSEPELPQEDGRQDLAAALDELSDQELADRLAATLATIERGNGA